MCAEARRFSVFFFPLEGRNWKERNRGGFRARLLRYPRGRRRGKGTTCGLNKESWEKDVDSAGLPRRRGKKKREHGNFITSVAFLALKGRKRQYVYTKRKKAEILEDNYYQVSSSSSFSSSQRAFSGSIGGNERVICSRFQPFSGEFGLLQQLTDCTI